MRDSQNLSLSKKVDTYISFDPEKDRDFVLIFMTDCTLKSILLYFFSILCHRNVVLQSPKNNFFILIKSYQHQVGGQVKFTSLMQKCIQSWWKIYGCQKHDEMRIKLKIWMKIQHSKAVLGVIIEPKKIAKLVV